MQNHSYYGCIDIGGTKVRLGMVDKNGTVKSRQMFLTPSKEPWNVVLEQVANQFIGMLEESGTSFEQIPGIGIGCPGTFDTNREIISFAPNLNWRNIPIKNFFEKRFPVPVWLENDTNLSTLGVSVYGEGKSSDTLIGIFIGTGIGGGIIIDKKLFAGATGGAGEIGHLIVRENGPECYCGSKGCIEAIASTRSIYEKLSQSFANRKMGQENDIFQHTENKSLAIKQAYMSGDTEAVSIIDEAFTSLGTGLVSLINVINPDMIVFGGGLAEALGEVIIARSSEVVRNQAMPGTFEKVSIVCTALGENAPVLGGAALVEMNLQS
jgi:glucokinase